MSGFPTFTPDTALVTQLFAISTINTSLQFLAAMAIGGFVILSTVRWLQKEQ